MLKFVLFELILEQEIQVFEHSTRISNVNKKLSRTIIETGII